MFNNSDELLKFIKDEGVEMIDVRFCDLPGIMQHFTVPVSSFDQSVFDDGLGFDGSSIRGFQAINEGRPEAMGESLGLSEAYGHERSRVLGNHCLWCDEFFERHAPELLR